MVVIENFEKLGDLLVNQSVPLKARYRALFTLKNLGGDEAVKQIGKGFQDPSALLKHECAYCLGQMQNSSAIPVLIDTLSNLSEDPMVRHEAGEALGALGNQSEPVYEALNKYANDPAKEVAETCQLALNRLEWLKKKDSLNEKLSDNPYYSVDPAPPSTEQSVSVLRDGLLDDNKSLFERYRAMFALRNIGTDEAIMALCDGLKCKGALFRHEIAYILGQIQSPLTVKALQVNLEDPNENHMVRHECAEALGSIATTECVKILEKYVKDHEQVVKESCEVALDITDYENSNDFQYANSLLTMQH